MDTPCVVGFQTGREVMDDLEWLIVLASTIQILQEGVVIVCQVVLGEIIGQGLSQGPD